MGKKYSYINYQKNRQIRLRKIILLWDCDKEKASDGKLIGGGGGSNGENTAKVIVAVQISQAVQSTPNLLRLIQQPCFSQAQLGKLPKNLLDRTVTIRNTGLVLEQLPRVISSLDEHMESALRSVPNLKTVRQLLDNMENNQLQFLSRIHPPQAETELAGQPSVAG